jgi:NADH-quinone oxidoreductase subunit F
VPVLRGDTLLVGRTVDQLEHIPSPLPRPAPDGVEECMFAFLREPTRASLEGYRRSGGYESLRRAITEMSPRQVIEVVAASGLCGRGGAGFPTGKKWQAVAAAEGRPKTVVCNADEGEPGCFKDRVLLDHDPHATIEGMALGAYATGASEGFLYLRYEYPDTFEILERAIAEAAAVGFLGDNVLGTEFSFSIHLRRGAGAYICGEETSLLNSLEGKHPFPRERPPYPVTAGYCGRPTLVNNVETLAAVPHIMRRGAEWYRGLGFGEHVGTRVVSVSGDIARPGNYEVPVGLPLATLLLDRRCGQGDRTSAPGVSWCSTTRAT